jgi:hypothetical protein
MRLGCEETSRERVKSGRRGASVLLWVDGMSPRLMVTQEYCICNG